MTISSPGIETIQIKTKDASIFLGKEVKIGDFLINGPGEYEISGIEVNGTGKIYLFSVEEMRLAYLDMLDRPLTDEENNLVPDVDILFIPIGGENVIDLKTALKIITQIDPRIVIPVHYDNIDTFAKEEGITPEFVDSLKVTSSTLPETERKVIVLPWKSSKKS